jgi:hypothetical protein
MAEDYADTLDLKEVQNTDLKPVAYLYEQQIM